MNSKDAAGGDGVTQFGRALLALNIDIICASSPQAKGRIERAFAAFPTRQQRGHIARRRPPNNLEAPGLPSKGRAPRHGGLPLYSV